MNEGKQVNIWGGGLLDMDRAIGVTTSTYSRSNTEVDIEVEINFFIPGFVSEHVTWISSTSWKREIQEWQIKNEMRATPFSREVLLNV